jgi:RNA polymerase sigma-70 factor (ECF subfamily)
VTPIDPSHTLFICLKDHPAIMPQQKDDDRFTELLRVHHTQLFAYLWALARDANDADDLYQQTSLVLWKKFGDYKEGTSFFNWAVTTARYEVLNFLRVRKHRRQLNAELQNRLNRTFGDLDASLLQVRLESLQECKDQLCESDRRLLDACYGNTGSFRETAEELGRSPKSVYDALRRIRTALLECVKGRLAIQERNA